MHRLIANTDASNACVTNRCSHAHIHTGGMVPDVHHLIAKVRYHL